MIGAWLAILCHYFFWNTNLVAPGKNWSCRFFFSPPHMDFASWWLEIVFKHGFLITGSTLQSFRVFMGWVSQFWSPKMELISSGQSFERWNSDGGNCYARFRFALTKKLADVLRRKARRVRWNSSIMTKAALFG